MKDTAVLIPVMEDRITLAERAVLSAKINNFGEVIVIGPSSIKDKFSDVIFVEAEGNTARRYNKGIEKATCKYIMFLNDDDFYLSLPDVYRSEENFIFSDYYVLQGGVLGRYIARPTILKRNNYIGYLTVRIKREILLKEKFDERIDFGEVYELWLRLQSKGIKFKYYPLAFAVYDNDSTRSSRKSNAANKEKRNQSLMRIRNKYNNINTPAYWDLKWRKDEFTPRAHHVLYDKIVDWIPDNSRVVDLGCGNGLLLKKIKKNAKNVKLIGIDFSAYALSLVDKDIRVIQSAVPPIPLESNSFDVAIAVELLEHLDDDKKMIEEMKRVASEVIVSVPDNLLREDYRRSYDETKLRELLGECKILKVDNYLLARWK